MSPMPAHIERMQAPFSRLRGEVSQTITPARAPGEGTHSSWTTSSTNMRALRSQLPAAIDPVLASRNHQRTKVRERLCGLGSVPFLSS